MGGGGSPVAPATPGGAGGAAPGAPVTPGGGGARPSGGGGGVPINIQRQRTSKTLLKMNWDYPVYFSEAEKALEESTDETVAQYVRTSLPREESFDWVAGDDPRPLLILRECLFCNGTDYALLNRKSDNEKTLLLSQWFHCVKLPNDVLAEDHPFRNLFDGKKPPHLFMCSPDGSNMLVLNGEQSRSELWSKMIATLKLEYREDPEKAVKSITKLLAEYDHLDSMEDWRIEQLENLIEKDGPKSRKVKKLQKQIAKLKKDKEKAKSKEKGLFDLGLIRPLPEKEESQPSE
ncbi:MAG TPA: hypothetical protein QGG59_05250 [Planctomycetota bacterium]|jgi:hypothetical protein|nr:hypothetical protein [Planctomycetota bacterium]MDP7245441.1 hypothetical protein [Planctomycetota bacterium]HJM39503.1 hypothetical protein [Planctomycetota bacterium]|tara:strand:- start:93977 stop:94846 length:870 start_codon:yes stop_codon:yes gene_type:complete